MNELIDWNNFDLVLAPRHTEDYAQFIPKHPPEAGS